MKYIVIQEKKNFTKLLLPNNIYIYCLNWYNGNTYIIVIKSIYVIVSKSEILNKKNDISNWY
jgi:cytochrome oxidase assembly protein ShyY1